MSPLALQTVKVGSALVVRYSGDPDSDLNNLTADFVRRMASMGEKLIVLDMEKVRKFASAAINSLIRILRAVQDEDGELALVNIPAEIMKILSMINIIGKFSVYNTVEELRNALEQKGGRPVAMVTPLLKLDKRVSGDTHTLAVSGPFVEGINRAVLIEEAIASLKQGARNLVIDFRETTVMDTVSVGILLTLHRMCEENRTKLTLANPNDILLHVMKVNGVENLFNVTH